MASTKIKTLWIYKLLAENSDESHPISTTELIEMLRQNGVKCERKSIYADIQTLNEVGFDIVTATSPKKGFFMAGRDFELAQVRLLIDAVSSAGFITPKKTEDLLKKLESLVSKNQAKELVSQVYIDSNTKCDNEEIYYVIDALHEAVLSKKKVKFVYKRRNIDVRNKKSYTEKTFVVSPYALIWKDDHYYLVCNNQKYENLLNLRLDRMKKIETLDDDIRPVSEVSEYKDSIDVADYTSKMFNMYSGTTGKVRLLCDMDLREEIIDRFGSRIPLTAVDSNHFETQANVAISDGFVSWIMNFGSRIKVLEPEDLATAVKQKALSIADLYE